MHRFGIDVGGTKIEGIVLDPAGRELLRERFATESQHGYDHILSRIGSIHERMRARTNDAPYTLGIGTPGSVSRHTGLMRNSNTLTLNGKPVTRDLERILGRQFTLHNDANCFALAEASLGAAKGHSIVFGVIMGTGCGGGIVINGSVHLGRAAIRGEWGHMSIDPIGPICYCGQRGCVETYISGSGLESRYRERTGRHASAQRIFADADRGQSAAIDVVDGFFANFGRSMANVIDILDPDIIVLGGGLSNIDALYGRGISEVGSRVFTDAFDTPIVRNALGDSAGVIGAALIGV